MPPQAIVARLPPELLLRIFLMIHQEYHWDPFEKAPPCSAVSHVCRQWRAVALGTSQLWTRIPLHSASWTYQCLARSRDNYVEAVTKFLAYDDEAARQLLMLVCSELHRISKLLISTSTSYDDCEKLLDELYTALSSKPAPKLRELEISISDDIDFDRPLVILPNGMFASQKLLSLDKLAVESCEVTLSWSKSLIAPSLRCLQLVDGLAWRTVDEMVQFFELVPNLEELSIDTINPRICCFVTGVPPNHPRDSVSLTKLRDLHITTRYVELFTIFAHLLFPLGTDIYISLSECDTDLDGDAEELEILNTINLGRRAFRQHFAPAVDAGIGHPQLRITSHGLYCPCEFPGCPHCDSSRPPPDDNDTSQAMTRRLTSRMTLPFCIPKSAPHLIRSSYAMILEQPVFQGTTSVCIAGILPPEAWSCLNIWTSVEELHITRLAKHALAGFVAAMHRQHFRLFPALRRLQIVNATIVEPDGSSDRSEAAAYEPVWGEGLRGTNAGSFLAAIRVLSTHEHFEHLTLTQCAMSTRVLQSTRDILGEGRVEADVETPEERCKWREERENEYDLDRPETWHWRPLPDTD
ncbi:unnamed protein product [Peniophora sp. CBMAI 1063]|nr:unnamed protein product [Peniophora sp. CBMAI 1063]